MGSKERLHIFLFGDVMRRTILDALTSDQEHLTVAQGCRPLAHRS